MEAQQKPADPAAAILQAAQCALTFLHDYTGPEKEQIPFLILAALAEETAKQLGAGVSFEDVKFDSRELTDLARKSDVVRGPAEGKESDWVNKHWKKISQLLEETREVLEETARRERHSFIPTLGKDRSRGGAKLRSYYRLMAQPVSVSEGAKELEIPSGCLRYRAERRKHVPWIGRLYIGAPLGRMRVILLFAVLALFLVAGFLVLSPLILQAFTPTQVDLSRISLGLALVGGFFYLLFGSFFRVAVWKVTAASLLFQPGDETETLLLEEVRDHADGKAPKRIDLVKYTGECPVCGGRVVVGSGGLRFWARLVGRCRNSPREHVFSFDHVTRLGAPL